METVQGRCPSCGSRSLFVGSGGYLTCGWSKCLNPTLISDLVEQGKDLRVQAERGQQVSHIQSVREQLAALIEREPFPEGFARFIDRLVDGRAYPQANQVSDGGGS